MCIYIYTHVHTYDIEKNMAHPSTAGGFPANGSPSAVMGDVMIIGIVNRRDDVTTIVG